MKNPLQDICKAYHITTMYAFGSRCKEIKAYLDGKAIKRKAPTSDADIGIVTSERSHLSVRDKARLMTELEDRLGVGRVDLVILTEADPFLAANIVRGERLYCADDYAADEYELYVLRRAGDLAPLERERLRLIFGETDQTDEID